MLKNKLKLLLSIIMIICLTLSPFCYADDEPAPTADKVENTTSTEVQTEQPAQAEENTASSSENTTNNNEEQANATENVQENSQQNTVTSSDVYLVGDNININYIVDGNAFIMANEVTISSQIVGNVYVMANKVTLTDTGYIGASLYALGNEVKIDGVVFDVYSSASSIYISGYIYRDLHTASENFVFSGVIGRDASLSSKNITFSKEAESNGNSKGSAGQCKIMGKLNYSSEKEAEIPGGVVEGTVKYEEPSKNENVVTKNYALIAITSVVFILAVWGLLKWLAPKFVAKSGESITTKPFKTFGFGLLGLIAIPIVSILLLCAGITASFGLLLMVAYIVLLCVSRATAVIAINNIVANKLKFEGNLKVFALLIATSAIAWAISIIPVIGGLVELILVIVGMGIIVRSLVSKKDDTTTNTEKAE